MFGRRFWFFGGKFVVFLEVFRYCFCGNEVVVIFFLSLVIIFWLLVIIFLCIFIGYFSFVLGKEFIGLVWIRDLRERRIILGYNIGVVIRSCVGER